MRGLKRIGGLLVLTLAFATAGGNVQTVFAAEENTADEIVVSTDATDTSAAEVNTDAENVTDTNEAEVNTDAENVTDTNEAEVNTDAEGATDTNAADAATDTNAEEVAVSRISTFALTEDEQKKDATVYTTNNIGNYHDKECDKDVIDVTCEEGETIDAFFKLNFTGATTVEKAFKHKEDLTESLCNNTLPEGLSLIKYANNGHSPIMRVELVGTAATGRYSFEITVPSEKLVAKDGYRIPENGVSVTVYLTVNGHKIPVTVPVTEVPAQTECAHEHNYSWQTIKEATETEDGIEGYVCSCGAVESTRTISAYGAWLKSVEKKILTAEENATVEVKTEVWNTYNKDVIDALQERTDVTLVTTFGKGADAVTFTIPAAQGTVIEEEATALAASLEEATGTVSQTENEVQWYGFSYLSGRYMN